MSIPFAFQNIFKRNFVFVSLQNTIFQTYSQGVEFRKSRFLYVHHVTNNTLKMACSQYLYFATRTTTTSEQLQTLLLSILRQFFIDCARPRLVWKYPVSKQPTVYETNILLIQNICIVKSATFENRSKKNSFYISNYESKTGSCNIGRDLVYLQY